MHHKICVLNMEKKEKNVTKKIEDNDNDNNND